MSEHSSSVVQPEVSELVASTISKIQRVLGRIGIEDATPDSVIVAPGFYDGPVLIREQEVADRFSGLLALGLRFVGYSFNDIALLTVRELAESYVRDSFPEIPRTPLSDDQYELDGHGAADPADATASAMPICFVLGCGRSGTTLLRAMLDVHPELWAPGELHLATFPTMADRAASINPVLRYVPIPEVAARLGESVDSASRLFRRWELEEIPVWDVYRQLYEADPAVMIVDKTPPYSGRLENLVRIGARFPNAKFIHLIRSPHDVVRSLVRMQLYKGARQQLGAELSPYHAAEAAWAIHNSNILKFLQDVPDERKSTVRYEELVSEPRTPLQKICDVLGLVHDANMEDPYASAKGRVAMGAGDMQVNFFRGVESRQPIEPFYPLGSRCRALAHRCGY